MIVAGKNGEVVDHVVYRNIDLRPFIDLGFDRRDQIEITSIFYIHEEFIRKFIAVFSYYPLVIYLHKQAVPNMRVAFVFKPFYPFG